MREEVEVVRSYLRRKLSSILDEAKDDPNSPREIISRFQSIDSSIKSCSDIPIELLYDIIHELSECRVFAHKAAVLKKGFYWFQVFWFKKNMTIRLDRIEERLKKPTNPDQRSSTTIPNHVIEQTCPNIQQDPSLIIGFESEAKKIEGWLLDKNIDRVGIVGGIGVGKTALAQKVFSSPGIKEEFSTRIWVCLSNVDTILRVYYYILEKIFEMYCGVAELGEEVQRVLTTGKRYLIVLDDVRRVDDNLLPKGSTGGGVVITTGRGENVIGGMVGDHNHVIRMKPLSNQICFSIFSATRRLQQAGRMPKSLIPINQDIIESFHGLPLAAKASATLLASWFWIPARELFISEGNDTRSWRWISSLSPPREEDEEEEEEEEEVAELLEVWQLEIRGRLELKKLLLKTTYSAYLVFKLKEHHHSLSDLMAHVRLCSKGEKIRFSADGSRMFFSNGEEIPLSEYGSRVFIDRKMIPGEGGRGFPQPRGKEWMEIKLGEFFNDDDDKEVDACLYAPESYLWKFGLIVKGIYFRPNPISIDYKY